MKALAFAAALGLGLAFPAAAQDAPAALPAAPALSLIGAVLTVTDPDKAVAFYRDGLGMKLAMTLDAGAHREYMMRFGTDFSAPGIILVHDRSPGAATTLNHGNAFSRIVIRVANLDALAARLDAAGYAHGPIRGTSNNYRMMWVTDPQGYKLELVQSGSAG
ncbi:MAG: hypothetical protein RIQ46_825 [Pseudomonadota bacterium]